MRDGLAQWNEIFKSVIELLPPAPDSKFMGRTSAYIIGNSIYSLGSGTGFTNHRRKEMIAEGSVDSIVLSTSLARRTDVKDRQRVISAGDIAIFDYTRNFKFNFLDPNVGSRYLTFNRAELAKLIPNIDDLHGWSLAANQPQTRLLTQSMLIMEKSLPHMTDSDGESISAMFGQLFAACLIPKTRRTAPQQVALLEAKRLLVKSFIEANLRSPHLGPAYVGASCGLSQSRLYALFPDDGGIANYIWARRLERAAKDLHDPAFGHVSLGQIAEAAGFTRQSHFSTAFKRRFGMTAKDWRAGQSVGDFTANKDGSFFLVDLLRQFSSPMRPYPKRKTQPDPFDVYLK